MWLALGLAVVAYHVAPLWRETQSWGGTRDWGYFFFLAEVDRKSVLEFGQFPLWNPYYCGGAPYLVNPQTYLLSPTFPFILAFGSAVGIRLTLTVCLLLAFEGMRRFTTVLGLHPLACAVAGTGFAVNGVLAQHLGGGHMGWFGFALLPWVLVSLHRWMDGDGRHMVFGGVWLAWILSHCGVYPFPIGVMTLGVYALCLAVAKQRPARAILGATGIVGIALALGAVRLFPILSFIADHPRPVWDEDSLRVAELWEIYAVRHTARDWGHAWVWPEYGNYFGLVGVALWVVGMVSAFRARHRRVFVPVLIGVAVFLLFQLGSVPGLPWWIVKTVGVPLLKNLRVPSRFTAIVGMFACVLIGLGITALLDGARRLRAPALAGVASALVAVVGLAYLVDASEFNRQQWRQTFGARPPTDPILPSFHQAFGNPNAMFAFPRTNQGSVNCFDELAFDISPALRVGLPAEEFPLDQRSGTVHRVDWSPNRVAVDVDFVADGVVVVNQNYDKEWAVSGGTLVSVSGLLGARVPPGRARITFTYQPVAVLRSLLVSVIALLVCAAYLVIDARRRRAAGPRPTAVPSGHSEAASQEDGRGSAP